MKRQIVPSATALIALFLLAAYFPPGHFTWHRFFADQLPIGGKVLFLLKMYGLPAVLSFVAIVLFQLQMRISMVSASPSAVFPLAILGTTAMLAAFRTMAMGVGGIPGYVLGLATAYTLMSRFAGIRPSGRRIMGVEVLEIVWRGQNMPRPMPLPGPGERSGPATLELRAGERRAG